jgi:hypothetical protein
MHKRWNAALHALLCVRLGQELGTSSELAQTIAHGIDFALGTVARFFS